jgi:acid phosphatase (class A)
MRPALLVLLAALVACSTPLPTKAPAATPAATPAAASTFAPTSSVPTPSPSYLGSKELDILSVVAPAPDVGSIRYEADRKTFLATRAFEGSPRWRMAADDAQLSSASLLKHFACALDVVLEPATVPQTLRLLQRSVRDAGVAMNTVKDHYKRLRPYRIDTGPLCRSVEDLGDTYDYPSGHAMAGWTWAMSLAQLAPDRTAPLLARGRAIGDSRVVCGLHNASAVDAARIAATAVMVALYASPEWQADARAARNELSTVRASSPRPDPKMCAEEAELIALPIG